MRMIEVSANTEIVGDFVEVQQSLIPFDQVLIEGNQFNLGLQLLQISRQCAPGTAINCEQMKSRLS